MFLKIHLKKSLFIEIEIFFADVHCMKYKIRWENKKFVDMGTLIRTEVPFIQEVSDRRIEMVKSHVTMEALLTRS